MLLEALLKPQKKNGVPYGLPTSKKHRMERKKQERTKRYVSDPENMSSPENIRALILAELIDCVAEAGNDTPKRHAESRAARFGRYLSNLEPEHAEYAAHLLVTSALGQLEVTRWYTRSSLEVLLELSRSSHAGLLVPARARIEQVFDDPEALKRWARPKRERGIPRGRAFVGTWSCAIGLWEVLQALHSPHAGRALTQMLQLHRVWRQVSMRQETLGRKRRRDKDDHAQPVGVSFNWLRRWPMY